jgi:regulator of protease activity HflC (stomatin/prohibitin superfamily)
MDKEQKIKNNFFAITFFIILLVIVIFFITDTNTQKTALIVLASVLFIYMLFRFEIILQLKEYERAVIFRFGKLNRVGGPGWAFVLPIIEKAVRTTLRTQVFDIPPQRVITKDNIKLTIDAVIYLSVDKDKESVINSIIKVEDYVRASTTLVSAKLRDILGEFDLTDVITNIDKINKVMTEALAKNAKDWGIKVHSVEISDVQIPEEIIQAMHEQKAAVQKKLAVYELAESEKAKILAVKEAAENLPEKAVIYYYIKALEKMAEGASTKFIFPMELTSLLSKVSAEINTKKDLQKIGTKDQKDLQKYLPLLQKYIDINEKTTIKKKKK